MIGLCLLVAVAAAYEAWALGDPDRESLTDGLVKRVLPSPEGQILLAGTVAAFVVHIVRTLRNT